MTKPGRKPTPTAIKMLRGNPGKRRLVPDPECEGDTNCPAWLSPTAKTEWKRVAGGLRKLGLLKTGDRAALAAYADAYGDWRDACEDIKRNGVSIKVFSTSGDLKFVQPNPSVGIKQRARKDMISFAAEFGMTPSSRSNVGASAEDEKLNEHLKFLRLD